MNTTAATNQPLPPAHGLPSRLRERLATLGVFLAAFVVFWASPHRPVADYQYALLQSQSLLEHGSFALERYFPGAAWRDPQAPWYHAPWQLQRHDEHVYYNYPPGASMLSVPLVALARLFGVSAVGPDGAYDFAGEWTLHGFVAAVLMAALAAVFYRTARLLLPPGLATLVALGAAFGSSIWSTASRGVWSQTWELLIVGGLLHVLLAHEARGRRLHPFALGLACGLLYSVRPTGSIVLALVGLYLLWIRRGPLRFAAGAAVPLALFAAWSRAHFGQWLPDYYQYGGWLTWRALPQALPGTLLSPSRGLLVFTPVLVWVAAVAIGRHRTLPCRRLLLVALAAVGAQQALLSLWPAWWGGHTYGARLSSGMLPWLVLLGVLALRARLDAPPRRPRLRRLGTATGLGLLLAGVLMNAPGALSPHTHSWNHMPFGVDLWPERRVWDWRRPQVLAVLGWPLPGDYPALPADQRVELWSPDSEPYLWGGWSEPDGPQRWTIWHTANVLFAWKPGQPALLRVNAAPFLDGRDTRRQRVFVHINNVRVGRRWNLHQRVPRHFEMELPGELMQARNQLHFQLVDAVPVLQDGGTVIHKGMAVRWLELRALERPADPARPAPR